MPFKEAFFFMEGVIFWGEKSNFFNFDFEGCLFSEEEIEVIINRLTKENYNTLNYKLEGEFSIVVKKKKTNTILLIRDSFGIIPLYYYQTPKFLAYSTNINYLINLPEYRKEPNLNTIYNYLVHHQAYSSYNEATFWVGINSVIPGQILEISPTSKKYTNFFNILNYPPEPRYSSKYKKEFVEVLENAIKKRIPSKNEIASHLSGGIDSSSITSVAATFLKNKIFTFEIRTENEINDERPFAQAVVEKHRLKHTQINNLEGIYDHAIKLIKLTCQPELLVLPSVRHFKTTKYLNTKNIKYLLTGHGGDSVLGLNNLYLEELYRENKYKKLNKALGQIDKKYQDDKTNSFSTSFWYSKFKLELKNRNFKNIFWGIYFAPIFHIVHLLSKNIIKKLFQKKQFSISEIVINENKSFKKPEFNHLDQINTIENKKHYNYLETIFSGYAFLSNEQFYQIGKKEGINFCFPYYDLNLVSLMANASKEVNFGEGIGRYIIRDSLRGILPDKIINRANKTAFNAFTIKTFQELYEGKFKELNSNHLIWNYVDKKKFLLLCQNNKIDINNNNANPNFIYFCNRVFYLAVWLDCFFEIDK